MGRIFIQEMAHQAIQSPAVKFDNGFKVFFKNEDGSFHRSPRISPSASFKGLDFGNAEARVT
jgi:hypothetical protein